MYVSPFDRIYHSRGDIFNCSFTNDSGIFVEQADGIFWDTMFWVRPQVDETGNMQAINWCPIALGYVYLAGGLFVLCRILLSFYRMFQLIRNGKRRSYGKYKLIVVSEPISSFCWGKYIVVSVSDYSQQSTDGILLHETMHLRYRHTLDLLCMQCLLILYWFNPAIWLLKRELQEVHEFEADNGVLNTGIDATRYQLLLVKKLLVQGSTLWPTVLITLNLKNVLL